MDILTPILSNLPPWARLLHLGSGTSDLHNQLRSAGFQDVTNIDYEPLAVKRGQDMEMSVFGDLRMKYVIADVTDLRLRDEKFDLVIDKSTVDAISCAGEHAVLRMAEGVRRCLAPGGVWVSLSYSGSRFEVDRLLFGVEVVERIPVPKQREGEPELFHWCYLLRP